MTLSLPIYMDYQATTPVDPRVLETMLPYFSGDFGNAASAEHRFGWVAEEAVQQARERVAAAIGARTPREILFTSGATESNNLAVFGVARRYAGKGNHVITLACEHPSVLDPCRAWERAGGRVTRLAVGPDGLLCPEALARAVDAQTILISAMWVNNEIGVIQPIAEIARIARERGVLFHTDATQAVGKLPVDVETAGIDLLSFSGHKIYGPKGVGVLYVRGRNPRVSLEPLLYGGGHEQGRRSGTLNVPGIVGLAKALELCLVEQAEEQPRLRQLRDRLWQGLAAALEAIEINGHAERRLAGNLNIWFRETDGAKLIQNIYADLAVSSTAACSSASPEPSHVLLALGGDPERARSSLRFGLGRFTQSAHIDYAVERVARAVKAIRAAG